jgi:hypothetical protein
VNQTKNRGDVPDGDEMPEEFYILFDEQEPSHLLINIQNKMRWLYTFECLDDAYTIGSLPELAGQSYIAGKVKVNSLDMRKLDGFCHKYALVNEPVFKEK